jgi:hypothetical protein
MQVVPNISKEIQQKKGFDEKTKLQLNSLLEEIDRKQQSSYQNTETEGKPIYIKFGSDKERKILLFTGNVNKKDMPAKDYETGLDIPDRYTTRFLFECYDITTTPNSQETNVAPAIWERGTKDARTILYYLSKDIRILEIVRNGQPYSTATTYLINPKLD